jgi:hypothetical protein
MPSSPPANSSASSPPPSSLRYCWHSALPLPGPDHCHSHSCLFNGAWRSASCVSVRVLKSATRAAREFVYPHRRVAHVVPLSFPHANAAATDCLTYAAPPCVLANLSRSRPWHADRCRCPHCPSVCSCFIATHVHVRSRQYCTS